MGTLFLIIKGLLMGIANIIPGVSGGTMAVSLGIYDELILSITTWRKSWRRSLRFLIPLFIGVGLGIVGFSYAIEHLLAHYTLPTALAFIGLIAGGLPALFGAFGQGLRREHKRLSGWHALYFVIFFALVVGLSFIKETGSGLTTLSATPGTIITLVLIGIIAAATMIVPGVSGSLILMIMGYYYRILALITAFFRALRQGDFAAMLSGLKLLVPFGIGVILGIILVSKLIAFLFERYTTYTYAGILGLILASPIAIIYNTEAWRDLTTPRAVPFVIVGLILAAACGFLTYLLSRTSEDGANRSMAAEEDAASRKR